MAKIVGIEGMSIGELKTQIAGGARFVVYHYCISALILTFKRSSDIQFIRAGENAVLRGLPFTLLTLVAGWWGIPWGPIHSISSLVTNLQGGKDVTAEILSAITGPQGGAARA